MGKPLIVIMGNPVDGFTFTGPFTDTDDATDWVDTYGDDWWTAPLDTPREDDHFPQTEEEARTCIHGNKVWFEHECGICDGEGHYVWKDEGRGSALVSLTFAYDLDSVAGALELGPDDEITDEHLRMFAEDDINNTRHEWEITR